MEDDMDERTRFYLDEGWKVPQVAQIVGLIEDDELGAIKMLDVLDQRLALVLARARRLRGSTSDWEWGIQQLLDAIKELDGPPQEQ